MAESITDDINEAMTKELRRILSKNGIKWSDNYSEITAGTKYASVPVVKLKPTCTRVGNIYINFLDSEVRFSCDNHRWVWSVNYLDPNFHPGELMNRIMRVVRKRRRCPSR